MYLVLPKPIEQLLHGLHQVQANASDALLSAVFKDLLEALPVLGASKTAIAPAKRAFMILGAQKHAPQAGLSELHQALAGIDEELGEEMGGFFNLLSSSLNEGEIWQEEQMDTSALPMDLRQQLLPFEYAATALCVLDDMSQAFAVPSELAASSLILQALPEIIYEPTGEWLTQRGCRKEILKLFEYRSYFNKLSDKLIVELEQENLLRPFALWVLAHDHVREHRRDSAESDLLNNLLIKAQLSGLRFFEQAGILRVR